MHRSRLSPVLLFAVLALAAAAVGCKKSQADTPPGPGPGDCAPLTAACSVGSDCCGGACVGFVCVDPDACGGRVGDACDEDGDCCTGSCAGPIGNQVCVNPETCSPVAGSCAVHTDCCEGECGAGGKCVLPEVRCLADGGGCTSGDQCCSSQCTGAPGAPKTCTSSLFCGSVGVACDSPADCCSLRCLGGSCESTACRKTSESCAKPGDCCSGLCGASGTCQALPAAGTNYSCKTLGEGCAAMADCCSTNCAGGVCMPSSPVGSAPGDICYRDDDCSSGICSGSPGRCVDSPGSCGLDGYPCTSDSNCCTRKCVDLGTGAKVCQPSGGCRMTGNYCDSTAACCGGTNEHDTSQKNTYGIFCDQVGQRPGHAEYDTSKSDTRTCSGGQACNPPGNICGYKASQNCCYEGSGSGKAVCKPDSGGILRCFGGPVNATCPSGWDANDPKCCKPEGAVCQFRDQCCGGTPCVPDGEGVLRCAQIVEACRPIGSVCADSPSSCCEGTTCQNLPEVGLRCAPTGCTGTSCNACRPNGNFCDQAGQCCSGICDGNACRAPCVPEAGTCTRNDDCCSGLGCSIPDGKTSGTCVASGGGGGGGPTCAATGQSCLGGVACCNGSDVCDATTKTCTTVTACVEVSGSCATKSHCCGGLECVEVDASETLRVCGTGDTACFCAQATCTGDNCGYSCAEAWNPCSTQVGCCSRSFCSPVNASGECTSLDPADCHCKPIG